MDKNALKDFAMKSRESLTRMMRAKLENLHIEDELTFKQHGNIWENEQHCLPAMTDSEYKRYESLKSVVKRDGLKSVIERAAYTWFNRIVAIRYMEVNDFLPLGKNFESLGINVLCDRSGDFRNPEILTISKLRSTDLKIDYDRINSLSNQDKYKEILLAIVKKLGEAIPDVFDGDTENIDALVPDGLLMPNGLIDNILKLGTDQFKRTEIIGWLYQYYNQAEKDRAMKLKTPTTKDDIPYVTQIFTPDWVVKYLVENSLGRYWLDRHPNADLETKWKYLVKKNEKTETIHDGNKIEDITFIDPCSGSGHILIYAFEVFYQIYESEGYQKCDIPQLILNNNLYGLDIDDRANQLSILACILVARKYDDKLFSKDIKQHILSIRESNKVNLATFTPNGEAGDVLRYLLDSFYDAKEYGSILKIRRLNYNSLREAIEDDRIAMNFGLDNTLEPLIAQAEILSKKYTIAVTNPPYLDKYNAKLKQYIVDHYHESRFNLAVVFMDVLFSIIESDGLCGIITIEAWMFLNYNEFRERLFSKHSIDTMLHLGNGVFSDVMVAVTAAIINNKIGLPGDYFRLIDGTSSRKEQTALESVKNIEAKNRYTRSSIDFDVFPGKVLDYWVSKDIGDIFTKSNSIRNIAPPKQGLITGCNDEFLRGWWELDYSKLRIKDNESAKWVPYNKGGKFRKWYGNDEYVVNWDRNGYAIKNYKKNGRLASRPQNTSYYFKPCITWSSATAGDPSFRYKPEGFIFDAKGSSMFNDDIEKLYYVQGLLNSKVILSVASLLSPTIDYGVGQVGSYPIIESVAYKDEIVTLVKKCIQLSREDWDERENSWNFRSHPLISYADKDGLLSSAYRNYEKHCSERFFELKRNEERINEIAIEIYGLNNELTPDVSEDRITVAMADRLRETKSFLSYFIGCIMGRFDYMKNGIQFAGKDTELPTNNLVDDDGVITILDREYLGRDDIINKLRKFLVEVFGEKNLSSNLDWIADSLGRENTERSDDCIRKYFVNQYYADEISNFTVGVSKDKRLSPIYWEISSGKYNAFKALFYIHRYSPNLVAKIRMDYAAPILLSYEKRRAEIETQLKTTVATAEYNRLSNELADLRNKIEELTDFDRILKNVADQKIELDLDDGVKVNYPKLSLAASGVKKNAQILEAIK